MNREELRARIESLERLQGCDRVRALLLDTISKGTPESNVLASLASLDPTTIARLLRRRQARFPQSSSHLTMSRLLLDMELSDYRAVALDTVASPETGSEDRFEECMRSVACAVWSELLAERVAPELREEAFLIGLLLNLGVFALRAADRSAYETVMNLIYDEKKSRCEAERCVFGIDHALAGKWLAEHWGFPDPIVMAIWLHHHSLDSLAHTRYASPILAIAGLSVALTEATEDLAEMHWNLEAVPAAYLNYLRLPKSDLDELARQARARIRELEKPLDSVTASASSNAVESGRLCLREILAENERLHNTCRSLEVQHGLLRALTQLVARVGDRLHDHDAVLDAVAEALRTGIGVRRAICVVRDDTGTTWRCRMWHAPHDELKRITLKPDTSGKNSLPGPNQSLLQELSVLFPEAESTPTSTVINRQGLVFLPLLTSGFCVGHLVFDADDQPESLTRLPPTEMLELGRVCAWMLRNCDRQRESRGLAEEFASAIPREVVTTEPPKETRESALKHALGGLSSALLRPVAEIQSRVQQLRAGIESKEQARTYDLLLQQCRGVHESLLDWSAIAGTLSLQPQPTLVNVLLHQILARMKESLEAKRIYLLERLDEGLPRVVVDRKWMDRALTQLLSNAGQRLVEGGGLITVASAATADRTRVTVTISETGPGVLPVSTEEVWESFKTVNPDDPDSGFGLTLCKSVVTAHGGELSVESRPGEGTRIVLSLPASADATLQGAPGKAAPDEAPLTATPTVLLIDTDDDLRELLSETLKRCGYDVHVAGNIGDAAGVASSGRVDVVLVDFQPATPTGLSTLSDFCRTHASLPIILMSAPSSEEELEETRRLGVHSLLTKPFQIRRLLAEVREAVAEKRGEN